MKYYDICRHCKKNNKCEGFVEKTEYGFRDVFFCPKFTHDDGTPFSQADRIRSMSDEELAEFLPIVSDFMCKLTDKCLQNIFNRGECEKTKECALKWLQSEVEE